MKKDDLIILATTFTVSFMILIFTVMIINIGNNSDKIASGTIKGTEASLALTDTETGFKDVGYIEELEEIIYNSDDIELELEDTALRNVEIENTYVNTIDLLPSITNQHETVMKTNVSTDNFSKSYAGQESATITVEGKGTMAAVVVPAEIYLYNVDANESGSYKLTVQLAGDSSIIKSIGYSSVNASLINLSNTSGNSTTISRASDFVGNSRVKIIVTYYVDENSTATQSYDLIVNIVDMTDGEIKLYDKKGIELFTDPDGTINAYLKDYKWQDKFYGAIKTTGWQNIDGKTYYYDYNSWPVTGNQIIGGVYYNFDKDGVLISEVLEKGIDVSLYQKEIDWSQVAASGISFTIIRCGFRGSASGRLVEDSYFRKNIEGAKKAGLKVGVYFYTQALNDQEAIDEANMVLELCKDYKLDFPIYADSEEAVNGRANHLDKESRTKAVKTFCEQIEKGGKTAGVYASKSWFYDRLEASELEQFSIWVAQYNNVCDYKGKTDLWQYSSTEKVNGISGNVDVNLIQ